MKLLAIFPVLLLAGLASTAPTSKENEKITIDSNFFPDSLAIYTAEHDIVNILVPLNALNFDDDQDEEDDISDTNVILFFVQAEVNDNGDRDYKGLYILKNGVATKLLDNGRDAAASNDDSKQAFFGASDGLYVYNAKENKADRYGTITDSIIGIAKENGTDVIYILTDDYQVYRVTEAGTKKTKLDNVNGARQIVLDYSNNLYFINELKQPYVVTDDGVERIEGIPENLSYASLLKPPFIIEEGVPFVADRESYILYANGSSEITEFELEVKPTAYAMEATLIQYFAYEKKIYEYNILSLILTAFSNTIEELKNFLEDKVDTIQSIATRSRSDLRA